MSMNNIIVWNRVSTLSQNENYSLEMQEKMCREYVNNILKVKVVKRVLNNTGSGYKINNELKQSYQTLTDSRNPLIICLSVDRFSRNEEYGLDIYHRIKSLGGRMIFILDNIDTSLSGHEEKFFQKLRQAESESKAKSERMKTSYQFVTNMKILNAGENLRDIQTFIDCMLNGGNVEDIYTAFRRLVDWTAHPDWEDLYQRPIEFDNAKVRMVRGVVITELPRGDITLNTIATIMNDFEIPIPIPGIVNKKWSDKLLQRIVDNKNNFNVNNLLQNLLL